MSKQASISNRKRSDYSRSPIRKMLVKKMVSYFDTLERIRNLSEREQPSHQYTMYRSTSPFNALDDNLQPTRRLSPKRIKDTKKRKRGNKEVYDDSQMQKKKLYELKELMKAELEKIKLEEGEEFLEPDQEYMKKSVAGYPSFMKLKYDMLKKKAMLRKDTDKAVLDYVQDERAIPPGSAVNRMLEERVEYAENHPITEESELSSLYEDNNESKEGRRLYHLNVENQFIHDTKVDLKHHDYHRRKSKEIRRLQYYAGLKLRDEYSQLKNSNRRSASGAGRSSRDKRSSRKKKKRRNGKKKGDRKKSSRKKKNRNRDPSRGNKESRPDYKNLRDHLVGEYKTMKLSKFLKLAKRLGRDDLTREEKLRLILELELLLEHELKKMNVMNQPIKRSDPSEKHPVWVIFQNQAFPALMSCANGFKISQSDETLLEVREGDRVLIEVNKTEVTQEKETGFAIPGLAYEFRGDIRRPKRDEPDCDLIVEDSEGSRFPVLIYLRDLPQEGTGGLGGPVQTVQVHPTEGVEQRYRLQSDFEEVDEDEQDDDPLSPNYADGLGDGGLGEGNEDGTIQESQKDTVEASPQVIRMKPADETEFTPERARDLQRTPNEENELDRATFANPSSQSRRSPSNRPYREDSRSPSRFDSLPQNQPSRRSQLSNKTPSPRKQPQTYPEPENQPQIRRNVPQPNCTVYSSQDRLLGRARLELSSTDTPGYYSKAIMLDNQNQTSFVLIKRINSKEVLIKYPDLTKRRERIVREEEQQLPGGAALTKILYLEQEEGRQLPNLVYYINGVSYMGSSRIMTGEQVIVRCEDGADYHGFVSSDSNEKVGMVVKTGTKKGQFVRVILDVTQTENVDELLRENSRGDPRRVNIVVFDDYTTMKLLIKIQRIIEESIEERFNFLEELRKQSARERERAVRDLEEGFKRDSAILASSSRNTLSERNGTRDDRIKASKDGEGGLGQEIEDVKQEEIQKMPEFNVLKDVMRRRYEQKLREKQRQRELEELRRRLEAERIEREELEILRRREEELQRQLRLAERNRAVLEQRRLADQQRGRESMHKGKRLQQSEPYLQKPDRDWELPYSKLDRFSVNENNRKIAGRSDLPEGTEDDQFDEGYSPDELREGEFGQKLEKSKVLSKSKIEDNFDQDEDPEQETVRRSAEYDYNPSRSRSYTRLILENQNRINRLKEQLNRSRDEQNRIITESLPHYSNTYPNDGQFHDQGTSTITQSNRYRERPEDIEETLREEEDPYLEEARQIEESRDPQIGASLHTQKHRVVLEMDDPRDGEGGLGESRRRSRYRETRDDEPRDGEGGLTEKRRPTRQSRDDDPRDGEGGLGQSRKSTRQRESRFEDPRDGEGGLSQSRRSVQQRRSRFEDPIDGEGGLGQSRKSTRQRESRFEDPRDGEGGLGQSRKSNRQRESRLLENPRDGEGGLGESRRLSRHREIRDVDLREGEGGFGERRRRSRQMREDDQRDGEGGLGESRRSTRQRENRLLEDPRDGEGGLGQSRRRSRQTRDDDPRDGEGGFEEEIRRSRQREIREDDPRDGEGGFGEDIRRSRQREIIRNDDPRDGEGGLGESRRRSRQRDIRNDDPREGEGGLGQSRTSTRERERRPLEDPRDGEGGFGKIRKPSRRTRDTDDPRDGKGGLGKSRGRLTEIEIRDEEIIADEDKPGSPHTQEQGERFPGPRRSPTPPGEAYLEAMEDRLQKEEDQIQPDPPQQRISNYNQNRQTSPQNPSRKSQSRSRIERIEEDIRKKLEAEEMELQKIQEEEQEIRERQRQREEKRRLERLKKEKERRERGLLEEQRRLEAQRNQRKLKAEIERAKNELKRKQEEELRQKTQNLEKEFKEKEKELRERQRRLEREKDKLRQQEESRMLEKKREEAEKIAEMARILKMEEEHQLELKKEIEKRKEEEKKRREAELRQQEYQLQADKKRRKSIRIETERLEREKEELRLRLEREMSKKLQDELRRIEMQERARQDAELERLRQERERIEEERLKRLEKERLDRLDRERRERERKEEEIRRELEEEMQRKVEEEVARRLEEERILNEIELASKGIQLTYDESRRHVSPQNQGRGEQRRLPGAGSQHGSSRRSIADRRKQREEKREQQRELEMLRRDEEERELERMRLEDQKRFKRKMTNSTSERGLGRPQGISRGYAARSMIDGVPAPIKDNRVPLKKQKSKKNTFEQLKASFQDLMRKEVEQANEAVHQMSMISREQPQAGSFNQDVSRSQNRLEESEFVDDPDNRILRPGLDQSPNEFPSQSYSQSQIDPNRSRSRQNTTLNQQPNNAQNRQEMSQSVFTKQPTPFYEQGRSQIRDQTPKKGEFGQSAQGSRNPNKSYNRSSEKQRSASRSEAQQYINNNVKSRRQYNSFMDPQPSQSQPERRSREQVEMSRDDYNDVAASQEVVINESSHYGRLALNLNIDQEQEVEFDGYGEVRIKSKGTSPLKSKVARVSGVKSSPIKQKARTAFTSKFLNDSPRDRLEQRLSMDAGTEGFNLAANLAPREEMAEGGLGGRIRANSYPLGQSGELNQTNNQGTIRAPMKVIEESVWYENKPELQNQASRERFEAFCHTLPNNVNADKAYELFKLLMKELL